MSKGNVTGIVLSTLGAVMSEVTAALADRKVTVGEVWSMTAGTGRAIVDAIPGAAETVVYRAGGHTFRVRGLLVAIDETVATGLRAFGVSDIVVGRV